MTEIARITELLQITQRLTAVLEREIEILRAMKPSELQALQEDKRALSAAYEAQLKALKVRDGALDGVPAALRAALQAATTRFHEALRQNERSLRAAKHASERVLRAIADEVERKRGETAAYGASGTVADRSQRMTAQPVSLAVDQHL